MELYVARQPIFDTHERVVGYELLYRRDRANHFDGTDGPTATGQLLSEQLLTDAWDQLTGGHRAWVNVPAPTLVDRSVLLVPPARIVVELLEDIVVDDAVLEACSELIDHGYALAADDVIDAEDRSPLLDLVDIVKVDFRHTTPAARMALARRFAGRAQLLAEKVETRSEQLEAVTLGYELLQGYFLHEPAVVSHRTIDLSHLGVLAVVAAVAKRPMDYDEVEAKLKREVALTDRFLRYLNSVAFAWVDRVETIHQGLVRLGEQHVRRWITVNALARISTRAPAELVISTLIRARMCEELARLLPSDLAAFELFLTGMYSQVHLLIGAELEPTVEQAPVPAAVRRALLGQEGPHWRTLELVVAWESGDWDTALALAGGLGLDASDVADCYAEAVDFGEAAGARPAPTVVG